MAKRFSNRVSTLWAFIAAAFFTACSPDKSVIEKEPNPDINDSVISVWKPEFDRGNLSAEKTEKLGFAFIRNGYVDEAQKCASALNREGLKESAKALEGEISEMRLYLLVNAAKRGDSKRFSQLCDEILNSATSQKIDREKCFSAAMDAAHKSAQRGYYKDAESFLRNAVKTFPNDIEAHYKLSKILFESENRSEAISAASSALGIAKEKRDELSSILFDSLIAEARFDEAEEFAKLLPEGNLKDLFFARLSSERGDKNTAAKYYAKFLNPKLKRGAEAFYEAGEFVLKNNMDAEIAEMTKYIVAGTMDREYFDKAAILLARTFMFSGDYSKAEAIVSGLLRNYPDDTQLIIMISEICATEGQKYSQNILERASMHLPNEDYFRLLYLDGLPEKPNVRTKIIAWEFMNALALKYAEGGGKPSYRKEFLRIMKKLSASGNADAESVLEKYYSE